LLISELAFDLSPGTIPLAKTAVLVGSVLSAVVAAVILAQRNAVYRRIDEVDDRGRDDDQIADHSAVEPPEHGG